MAIQWKWDEKCGEATLRQTAGDDAREFTLSLYTGNCYLILLHEFEEDGKQMYNMHSFWADKKHMENCLGLTKGKENIYSGYQTSALDSQRVKRISILVIRRLQRSA